MKRPLKKFSSRSYQPRPWFMIGVISGFVSLSAGSISTEAPGQTLVNPNHHTNGFEAGGAMAISEVKYEVAGSPDTIQFERKFVVGTMSMGLEPGFAAIMQAGISTDSEIDKFSKIHRRYEQANRVRTDNGYIVGAGTKGAFYQYDRFRASGYGMLNYARENYQGQMGDARLKARTSLLEMQGGASAAINLDGNLKPYTAVEVVPVSIGSIEVKSEGTSGATDLERDDVLNLKMGVVVAFADGYIRPEVTLVGERSFSFSGVVEM